MEAEQTLAPEVAARPRWRRRHFVVDRGFQMRHTLMMSGAALAISSFFGAMMYKVHTENTAILKVTPEFMSIVRSADRDTLLLIIVLSIGLAVMMGVVGLWVTHRVAGPLWVIAHYIDILGKGRYPSLRPLRKGDQLMAFFARFRDAVEGLRERDRTLSAKLASLADTAASDPAATSRALRELAEERRRTAEDLVQRPLLDELPH